MLPFILLTLILPFTSSAMMSNTDYLIACGISKSTTSQDGRTWQSDNDPVFAPVNISQTSSSVDVIGGYDAPYTSARIFNTHLTYSFPVTPGPKFLRLYFTTATPYKYNTTTTIPASGFFLTVEANGKTLLHNFSAFQNYSNDSNMFYEYHLTIQKGQPLNLALSTTSYGFINGIQITSVPEGLYLNSTRNPPLFYVSSGNVYPFQQEVAALQIVYRINVGGSSIDPVNDSGTLGRTWKLDDNCVVGNFTGITGYPPSVREPFATAVKYSPNVPSYVAPRQVYGTLRMIGLKYPQSLTKNLTWRFDVDPGFDYMVRLHFCEMDRRVTKSHVRVFDVYINNETADTVDVWEMSGGSNIAMFRDYVVSMMYGLSQNGIKVPIWLALHPKKNSDTRLIDAFLNGVEILKLNQSNGSLAATNPPLSMALSPPSVHTPSSKHLHTLPIILGTTGLASLFFIVCLIVYKWRANKILIRKENMDTNTGSKDKWAPISFDLGNATTNTMSSSLPSDLCRHFTFIQIRVATRDFDENLVIGRGGFGKVYKGSIDGGATKVAIKRLNSTSKQGVREFQTEIEMLSRLRHVHLVSLIGYCEDEGEMILVYEYMPRGTLRDHLFYKAPDKIDNTNNNPLSWKQRLMICVGSARGLHYLHAGAKQLIIHRDVKSTNILLDDKWMAKVSDFGLSKVGPDQTEAGATYVSTAVKGSAGYLDPEYFQRHQLTEKSDVYSFGVVLFEVLCARAAVNPNLPKEQANLAIWAQSHYKKGTLHTIVDPNLTGQIAPESLRKFGEIATMCVRDRGIERPSMGDIVWGLEFALQLQETAEDNKIANGTPNESFDLSSSYLNAIDVGFTDNDISTNSGNNFSQSSVVEGTSKKFMASNSKSTTSSSSDYLAHSKPGSVFSEITHPTAR
ncbi:putative receptor-like protein kinase At5g39000 [Chenopodium quinoa]|uniref:Protein kinase domain-containing protein n=1 Tax=Chenopodium quinoa TaxID=63459 RepID=A0A803M450_CHEQI|nr:putative receptor-like protein kinase At5g39000 [Chenopodium quinoa]